MPSFGWCPHCRARRVHPPADGTSLRDYIRARCDECQEKLWSLHPSDTDPLMKQATWDLSCADLFFYESESEDEEKDEKKDDEQQSEKKDEKKDEKKPDEQVEEEKKDEK